METPMFVGDLVYAARTLAKRRSGVGTALVALALATGSVVMVYQAVNATILNPLPFRGQDRLFVAMEAIPGGTVSRGGVGYASFATYFDIKERAPAILEDAAAVYGVKNSSYMVLTGAGDAERVYAVRATPNFFDVLGVSLLLGRRFSEEEQRSAAPRVAILSEALWRSRYAGRADLSKLTVTLNQKVYNVAGVAPQRASHPMFPADVWIPLVAAPSARGDYMSLNLRVVGRLKPGVSFDHARNVLGQVYRASAAGDTARASWKLSARTMADIAVGSMRSSVLLLLMAIVCLVLVACANVSGILLARSASRAKEIATRIAIGASRSRLIGLFAAESALLSVLGGIAGVVGAYAASLFVQAGAPVRIVRMIQIQSDGKTFGVLTLVVACIAFVCCMAPVIVFFRSETASLSPDSAAVVTPRSVWRFQKALVAAQVAASLVLAVVSILLVKSDHRLTGQPLGFDPENRITMQIALRGTPLCACGAQPAQSNFYNGAIASLGSVPGVASVGGISELPFADAAPSMSYEIDGLPIDWQAMAGVRTITPTYVQSMGIPLLAGRAFTPDDRKDSSPVAIVTRTMARNFPDPSKAVGARFRLSPSPNVPWITVVGVVGDLRQVGLEGDVLPEVFLPHTQTSSPSMRLVVNTRVPPSTIVPALRASLRAYDAYVPAAELRPMNSIISESLAERRFTGALVGAFGWVVLCITGIGVYSLQSYTMAMRRREIGIRMALGAQNSQIVAWLLGSAARIGLAGVALGSAGCVLIWNALRAVIFRPSPLDIYYIAVAAAIVLAAVLIASYMPARKSCQLDPNAALRENC